MPEITCLRCKQPIESTLEQCPHCSERVTNFQRTYASRLIDGKYQILDRLGIGGMGEIFKVRHIHLNELRVIKIMRPNVAADDQGLQRFLQEARTSTTIKQKNLAMLYDFAQLDDGSYYMVWEFIDGTNIQKWIAQNGPMPPRLTVEISLQALSGLDHLHSMGLIHRDVSPENIMLSQDHHGKLLVKVIDFGIAKQLAEGESGQGLTQTGMFLGKLKYASPEQAGFLKEGEHLDARSDLYSFGIVMYEMLAGRAPFQATNPHGYILKHVSEKPAPIVALNPNAVVPPQLEAIIFKALEKSRDQRFATAADFAASIESIRGAIPPDQKYGLGERMVTLSAQRTVTDVPKFKTGQAATLGSARTDGGGPQSGTLGSQPTVVERRTGSNEPTVMERVGSQGSPTAAERKYGSSAEPTVLEPRVATATKRNMTAIYAAAAVVVIAVGIGSIMVMRKPSPTATTTTVAARPSGAVATVTAAVGTAPIPVGQGVLLLSASPWADLENIINEQSKKVVDLNDEKRSTPTRIELDPGKYLVTVSGPSGKKTFDVQIDAGKRTPHWEDMGGVNFEDLQREVTKQ